MNSDRTGKLLTELRKEKGLTQQQVAEIAFVSRESVSKWERGINTPDAQSLLILSKLYNITANEILYGERETKDNKEEIANTTISILSHSAKKISRLTRIFISILLLTITFFTTLYFISNYNSIKLYVISGEGEKFGVSSGIILTSPEKNYIQLGEIVQSTKEETEINDIYFYYEYEDIKINIANYYNEKILLVDLNNIPSIKAVGNMKKVYSNLYLDIYADGYKEKIKLNTRQDFSNNKLVHIDKKEDTNTNKSLIKENYEIDFSKFKEKNGKLVYKTNNYSYEYDDDTGRVNIRNGKIEYFYLRNIKQLYLETRTGYDFINNKCIEGNCDKYNAIIQIIITELFK